MYIDSYCPYLLFGETTSLPIYRQAYAKMYKYVADTFQIRQTYVTITLLVRYQYASCTVHIHASVSPAYDQRHRPMSNVPLAYL